MHGKHITIVDTEKEESIMHITTKVQIMVPIMILEDICKACDFLSKHDKSNPQEQYILRILKIPSHFKGGFGINLIKFSTETFQVLSGHRVKTRPNGLGRSVSRSLISIYIFFCFGGEENQRRKKTKILGQHRTEKEKKENVLRRKIFGQ